MHLASSGTGQDSLRGTRTRARWRSPRTSHRWPSTSRARPPGRRTGAAPTRSWRSMAAESDSAQLVTLDMLRVCTQDGPGLGRLATVGERYPEEVLDAVACLAGGARFPALCRGRRSARPCTPGHQSCHALQWSFRP